ncbi:MAG TPA: anthranilate synthase component I family protein [Puia sp.]|nr:anthranilate synthase component I family protein [Puia sp.]
MDNQGYPPGSSFECLLAVGAMDTCSASAGSAFSRLQTWASGCNDWLFGHFGYELAAETEGIVFPGKRPQTEDPGFPDLFFFIPEIVLVMQNDHVRIGSFGDDQDGIWKAITDLVPQDSLPLSQPDFKPRFTKEDYLSTVAALRAHILRGDCYEINFCMEFFASPADTDPLSVWWALSQASPNPFSAFYRIGDRHLFCASPERFLRKSGHTVLSQPIKGTAPRIPRDSAADRLRGHTLSISAKDRAENVMVVDLVRNDLSRICLPGSVHVPELYGIYAFPQVYQMISTVAGELRPGLDWTEAVRASFPMGSMTGAPKNSVVRLIARYERSRRGLFSGALGYVDPAGNFDFNVVIRSLLYNRRSRYLSYQVGSGITFYSDPAAEYEECLIKAGGIRKAFA